MKLFDAEENAQTLIENTTPAAPQKDKLDFSDFK